MNPLSGLGQAGKGLCEAVVADLPDGWELDERERVLLNLAGRQADDLARLERVIAKKGAMALGSTGQPVVHPAVAEARQARLAISKLIGELELPDEEEKPSTSASKRAKKAADARWGRRGRVAAVREAATCG